MKLLVNAIPFFFLLLLASADDHNGTTCAVGEEVGANLSSCEESCFCKSGGCDMSACKKDCICGYGNCIGAGGVNFTCDGIEGGCCFGINCYPDFFSFYPYGFKDLPGCLAENNAECTENCGCKQGGCDLSKCVRGCSCVGGGCDMSGARETSACVGGGCKMMDTCSRWTCSCSGGNCTGTFSSAGKKSTGGTALFGAAILSVMVLAEYMF